MSEPPATSTIPMWFYPLQFLLSDFRLLKLSFLLLTGCMIVEELRLCLRTRPTLLSVSKKDLEPSHFPEVLVCPQPGFDVAELQSLGYNQTFRYTFGLSREDRLVGWTGNQAELNITEVIRRISIIKDEEDCPTLLTKFKETGGGQISLTPHLTRALYPHGRCCRQGLVSWLGLKLFRLQVQSPS